MNRMMIGVAVGAAILTAKRSSLRNVVRNAALQEVASFAHQVTGVTVSSSGRIFVNFPRWTEDIETSVAELKPDGSLTPYPDIEWNSWRNARRDDVTAMDHFVCVQSVVMDRQDNLWVLDPGAPAQSLTVPGAPKLVQISLATNAVTRTISFDEQIAPQGSYLNDVRFSPDGGTAYMTDSGAIGALVVVDLNTGKARRVLHGHFSTQPEKDVHIKADGRVLRRTDGRGVEFAADGIALDMAGAFLYWQAIRGKTLYRIRTDRLLDAGVSAQELAGHVERVGENGPCDGLWMDDRDNMYISAVEENAIRMRQGNTVTMILQDGRLRWPDTFSEGPDGMIYITSSRIMDMNWFNPRSPLALKTTLYRFDPRVLPAYEPAPVSTAPGPSESDSPPSAGDDGT